MKFLKRLWTIMTGQSETLNLEERLDKVLQRLDELQIEVEGVEDSLTYSFEEMVSNIKDEKTSSTQGMDLLVSTLKYPNSYIQSLSEFCAMFGIYFEIYTDLSKRGNSGEYILEIKDLETQHMMIIVYSAEDQIIAKISAPGISTLYKEVKARLKELGYN